MYFLICRLTQDTCSELYCTHCNWHELFQTHDIWQFTWHISIHSGRVANALGCNARGHEFKLQPRRYFWDLFSRIDTVSGTEGLKMARVTLRNLLRPAMSVVLTGNNYLVKKIDRCNKYQTKQLHAHTYTCTHNSWWLVLGWVTTKEYHLLHD